MADYNLSYSAAAIDAAIGAAQTAVQPGDNISGLTNDAGFITGIAFSAVTGKPTTLAGYGITDAATSTQGGLADSAVQPGDNISSLVNDTGFITGISFSAVTDKPTTLAGYGITDAATSTQGGLADSAVQPGDNVSGLTNDAGYITGIAFSAVTDKPTTLSGYGITDAQAVDAGLTSIAGLTTAADNMIYTTASDTYAVTTLTTFARSILDDADAATARTTLDVDQAGTDNSTDVTLNAAVTDVLSLSTQAISAVDNAADGVVGWDDSEGKLTYLAAADVRAAIDAPATADLTKVTVNAQTGDTYQLVLSDAGKTVTMSYATANTLTIPANASVAFATGTVINVIQKGAGATTIEADATVTLNGVATGSGAINNQWQGVSLLKVDTNEWIASGDIATVA